MQDSKMQSHKISEEEILKTFNLITQYYEKYLKSCGVKSIKLKDSKGNYTKDALVLVYLAQNYPNTKAVSKTQLTDFIRVFYPNVSDVQQARHLSLIGETE
ncbi:hypothetical protein ACRE1S_03225 [Helicobacter himalayensis]|uniref:hypothetical protein n=1 Tax=Helicobacter himalayensis TaxID=1591088 RepID=UPI003D6DF8E0